jgi:glycolate oxidase
MYNRIDAEVVAQLQAIVGSSYVFTDSERMEPYSHDETAGLSAWPEVVVKAGSRDEIAAIMKLANEKRIPVTPRAGGQGLSGGSVPLYGGISLSVERMNRILEIDHENLMAVVEPGVITGDLHRAVEAQDLMYPPDPASQDSCCLGGNVAESAGGPRAVKYGTTKDYVMGLEVVLPSGEFMELGGKMVKDVAGYDLVQLIVGSEVTLGIVTKIILRLVPLPKARIDLLVPYDDFQACADTVSAIIAECIVPTALEFMERDTVKACERLLGKDVPFSDVTAQLLIQLTGQRQEEVQADMDRVGEICLDHGAIDVLVAQDTATRDRLWEARRLIIEALKNESPIHHMEDLSVPRAKIPELLGAVHAMSERLGVRALCFGHAGDGNVHVNLMKDKLPDDEWERKWPAAQRELYALAISLGGAITGEHGIGATRKAFLAETIGAKPVELMRGIKQVFDPNLILNPGKIFA